MSVFASPIRYRPWLGQVTMLSVVMGGLLGLSLKTQDQLRQKQIPNMRVTQLAAAYAEMRDTVNDQTRVIADLRKQLQKWQEATTNDSRSSQLLMEDVRRLNMQAGMTAVTGPGVVVTLRDANQKLLPPRTSDISPQDYEALIRQFIIHDSDIQAVINELRVAGAEAIAVNEQRVVGTTAIRCVGPVVLVNNVQTNASPVRIQAIGDPDTLQSSLSMPAGTREQFKLVDPSMFTIDKVQSMTLPAYAGAMPFRYARPATELKADQAQRNSEAAAKAANHVVPGGTERR